MGEMPKPSDAQLLRDYAERGAETAFAEIVARHTDLVYSAALRQVYSPDLARDVTQGVFTDLARKARTVSANLSPEASLVGWLYRGTRFAARDLYRNETRRTQRERQAMEQLHPAPESPPDWDQLRPVLDDAMSELDDTDRDAVLLRYFKNHDLRTVGATLGISDDAAQKRVSRAVERLREFFAKRGITVGASGLAVVISANAVQAAPIGLAVTVSTAAALTGTTLAATATATTIKTIAMTALQKTIVTATVAVLAGAGIYEARQASKLRNQVQTLQQQQTPLTEQIQALQSERDIATNRLGLLRDENARFNRDTAELLKLRGEVGILRWQTNELEKLRAQDLKSHHVSSEETQASAQTMELVSAKELNVKLWLEAFFAYARKNQGQCPETFQQAASFLPESVREISLITDQFEILYHGSLDAIKDQDVIVFREKGLWQHVGGKWGRFYGIATGHAQYCSSSDKTATGNFDEYEKGHVVQSPRQ
jgi:RNA polymerase sigma factor (sigma-70 family)